MSSLLIVNNHTKHLLQLQNILEAAQQDPRIGLVNVRIIDYGETTLLQNTDEYDGIILSGSSDHSWSDSTYQYEYQLIRSTPLPLLGICLGCQLIAAAYGSSLSYLPLKRSGLIPITYLATGETAVVEEAHHWAINSLGEELVAIAVSDDGFEVIEHVTKPQTGVQRHPELSHATGYAMLQHFLISLHNPEGRLFL